MTTYGVTGAGFVKKTLEVLLAEHQTDMLAYNPTLNLDPQQPIGQIIAIMARREAALWNLAETAFGANDPRKAEFFLLDGIGALRGVPRMRADYSRVTVTLNLNAATTLPALTSKMNVLGNVKDVWVLETAVTSTTAGTYYGTFRSDTKGPRVANASTLSQILTPISGWNSGVNAADATPGRLAETDTAYLARQELELAKSGSSTTVAIRAALVALPGMIEAHVFENTTASTDADGLPPHSVQAVIWDGVVAGVTNNTIAQALWDNKGGGIAYYGGTTGTAIDSEGVTRTIAFDRAVQDNVYLAITVSTDPSLWPLDGVAQVKEALRAKGAATLKIGTDVVALALRAAALVVPGALDVPAFTLKVGSAPSGGDTANLVIGSRHIALVDTSHIAVTVV